jgi:hypothetical protein
MTRCTYPVAVVDGWHWAAAILVALLLPLWVGGILIVVPLVIISAMALAS